MLSHSKSSHSDPSVPAEVEVSFIIPAYNEESLIGETVGRLRDAATELEVEHEIIVVNDNSDDATAERALEAGAMVIDVDNRQIAATRNAGARRARGETLVFVDADTLIPNWTLQNALMTLDEGAVGGGGYIRFRGTIPFSARVLVELIQVPLRLLNSCGGCFMFMRRWAFDAAGGFDETLYASEEVWLARRLGQLGRFRVLRQASYTSGRKARQYSFWQLIGIMLRVSLPFTGASVKGRKGLDVWYSGQREAAGEDD